MGEQTSIAWTDHTFNPWFGCTKVSPGCDRCYAQTFDKRIGGDHWGSTAARRFFGDKHWNQPRKWNAAAEKAGRRARVFCASMADVFEDRRDLDEHRARLFDLILDTPCLDWQLLTKRPENMVRLAWDVFADQWPSHVWAGCTAEDQERADQRIPHLLRVPAAVRFVSYEPAVGLVDFTRIPVDGHAPVTSDRFMGTARGMYFDALRGLPEIVGPGLDWIIVGGESGPSARRFELRWVRSVVRQCEEAGVAAFVKQLGADPWGTHRDAHGPNGPDFDDCAQWSVRLRDRKGGDMSEWPEDLRIRQFPGAR